MTLVINCQEGPCLTVCRPETVCQTGFLADGGGAVQFIARILGVILIVASWGIHNSILDAYHLWHRGPHSSWSL